MKNKKKTVGFTAVISITVSALISAFALAFLNSALAPEIEANQVKEIMKAINIVIPNVVEVQGPTEDDDIQYYKGYDANGQLLGYAIRAFDVGYAGDVPIIVGYDNKLEHITAVVVLDNLETPNIGSKVSEPAFINQFNSGYSDIVYRAVKGANTDLDNGVINAVSGATVSSTAVVNAINKAGDYIVEKLR